MRWDPHRSARTRQPALLCLDPYHMVAWAMKALDKVWVCALARAGVRDRRAMWAVRKDPHDLTGAQRTSLAQIAATYATLYRAYLLKEQLREVFRVKGEQGRQLPDGWLSWASHSHTPEFVALARTIRRHGDLLWNTLDHGQSNTRSEATNTHLRALTKRSQEFHSPDALIAMAMLTRGGLCHQLPGRAA
ncbi:transposase [Mycobacterium gastri]